MRIFTRDDLGEQLRAAAVNRGLAVVVITRLIDPKSAAQYVTDWQRPLAADVFRRVVLLEAGLVQA